MNRIVKTLFLLLLTGISGISLFAQQDDEKAEAVYSNDGKGWVFGLNVGVYYPSKNTAAFYNGNPGNVNNANFIMSNFYQHQAIFEALDANDSISIYGLPQNMHYKLSIQPGLYAQYCFSPTLALVIQFNYMRLKANDVIIFEVDPKTYATEPDLRLYPIRGIEERVYGDIGLKRTFPQTEKLSYFMMGGINVNSTKVIKSSFYVEEIEYDMINRYGNNSYVPNSNMQTYNVYQGGIGVGMFAGAGAAFTFANSIVIEPGINAHWLMVKLENYKNMNPGIGAYIRFMF